MKTYRELSESLRESTLADNGRVQVHYDSTNGKGQPIKIIATVPPMQEPEINNKYDMIRYVEKYIKSMKSKGIIKGNYEVVFPDSPKWYKWGGQK